MNERLNRFLRERTDEDEKIAIEILAPLVGELEATTRHPAERLLHEVAMKRALVRLHTDGTTQHPCIGRDVGDEFPCPVVRHVAAVYADHPDYDPSWTPDLEWEDSSIERGQVEDEE